MAKNKPQKVETLKGQIQELGLGSIKEYLTKSPNQLVAIKPEILKHMHNQAKLGMQFEREANIDRRTKDNNHIRIFKIIANDKAELKKLIKEKLPEYF